MEAVRQGPDSPGLSEPDQVMLRFSRRLTLHPDRVRREDLEELRRLGFSDSQLLDIVQVVAYFNYVNRMADGLGVELEPRWKE